MYKRFLLATLLLIFVNSGLFASYDEALKLYEASKYRESLKMIAEELDITKDTEPDSPNYDLRFLAAHDHWKLGNVDSAITHFKRCIDIQKENVDPLIDLSLLLIEKKRYASTRFYAKKALLIEESSMAYYALGQSFLGNGNNWKAKEYFEKAISIDPDLGIFYNGLGIALVRLKRYNQAQTAFSAALAVFPSSPEIINNIGICFENLGKFNKAYEHFLDAASKNPENSLIQKNLQRVMKKLEER